MNLDQRIIVVTGGARGLGRAFAESCAKEGARCVIIADILEEGATTAQALKQAGYDVRFIRYDQGDPESIVSLAEQISAQFDHIDGLVNNAAIATGIGGKSYEEIDIDTWDRVMRVNVRGVWLVIKALTPLLRKSTLGARIVNLASDTALWGAPKLLHYVGSKGAIISMTRSLAREIGEYGIAVNAIAPGLTIVEATEYVPKERHDHYINGRPFRRKQLPDDVVGPVIYLLGSGAAFVTGQVIPVNGGFVFN